MSGNPLLNQILDSKSSRQSTFSKKVPMVRNKDFMGNINQDINGKRRPN
jgi:hypothetical protein